jgi:hypothetical protein
MSKGDGARGDKVDFTRNRDLLKSVGVSFSGFGLGFTYSVPVILLVDSVSLALTFKLFFGG